MSGMEIERKFLVNRKRWETCRKDSYKQYDIMQGYLCKGTGVSVRVRLRDDKAFLTIKGPSLDGGLSRYEFEKEISADEALNLLALCRDGKIEKVRFLYRSGRHTFEIDEFHGANEGLIIAEVELASPDEPFTAPPFLAEEVTGQRKYYNSSLTVNPLPQTT